MKTFHFLPLLFITACAPTSSTQDSGINPVPFNIADNDGLSSSNPADAKVPLLRSPALEKRWGKPKLSILADGSYRLRYDKPKDSFESLLIMGSPKTFPTVGDLPPAYQASYPDANGKFGKPIQPEWQAPVIIAGKSFRFAQYSDLSGADPIRYASETLTLTAPDGRSGSYRIVADSNLEIENPRSYIETVNW